MEAATALSLSIPAEAASLRAVREQLVRVLEASAFSSDLVDAARIAVHEACANAVRHAYPLGRGVIEIAVTLDGDGGVAVVVRDHGQGVDSPTADPGAGFGFSVIHALATRVELASVPGGGTEVLMEFSER